MGEAERCIPRLKDRAVMRYPVQERGCHLGIAEDRDPFTELQVGGDDDAGFLIELADEVE